MEDTLVEFLERGATIETDVLNNLKSALPGDVVRQLDELIPAPPNQQPEVIEVIPEETTIIYTADAVLENQIGEHSLSKASERAEATLITPALKAPLLLRCNERTSLRNPYSIRKVPGQISINRGLGRCRVLRCVSCNGCGRLVSWNMVSYLSGAACRLIFTSWK